MSHHHPIDEVVLWPEPQFRPPVPPAPPVRSRKVTRGAQATKSITVQLMHFNGSWHSHVARIPVPMRKDELTGVAIADIHNPIYTEFSFKPATIGPATETIFTLTDAANRIVNPRWSELNDGGEYIAHVRRKDVNFALIGSNKRATIHAFYGELPRIFWNRVRKALDLPMLSELTFLRNGKPIEPFYRNFHGLKYKKDLPGVSAKDKVDIDHIQVRSGGTKHEFTKLPQWDVELRTNAQIASWRSSTTVSAYWPRLHIDIVVPSKIRPGIRDPRSYLKLPVDHPLTVQCIRMRDYQFFEYDPKLQVALAALAYLTPNGDQYAMILIQSAIRYRKRLGNGKGYFRDCIEVVTAQDVELAVDASDSQLRVPTPNQLAQWKIDYDAAELAVRSRGFISGCSVIVGALLYQKFRKNESG
ncbi:hypothetical protein BT63DRAFT_454412 [Microthyrium microscopicum]|uniref:Uncharacterized protein n=1 Tax=Microthyrium microscopicum TaxID=703497 RepID=A0A6A6UEK3_9PEZI|nr:hypothetical protein BT63DRAFT_454412 [Microthyrium microscopicum]